MVSGLSLSYNFERKKEYLKGFIKKKILVLMVFAFVAYIIGEILKSAILGIPVKIDIRFITGWNWYI